MGCVSPKSDVSPAESSISVKKLAKLDKFQEKDISQSNKPSYSDANNNKSDVKRPFKNPPRAVQPKPKEKEEIDVHTLSVLEGHDNYIDLAAWAPNDDNLVTASSDKKCYLWSLHPNQPPEQELLRNSDIDSAVSSIAWSDDGLGVVLGHDDGKVSLWSVSAELVFTWWPHEAPVTMVC